MFFIFFINLPLFWFISIPVIYLFIFSVVYVSVVSEGNSLWFRCCLFMKWHQWCALYVCLDEDMIFHVLGAWRERTWVSFSWFMVKKRPCLQLRFSFSVFVAFVKRPLIFSLVFHVVVFSYRRLLSIRLLWIIVCRHKCVHFEALPCFVCQGSKGKWINASNL